MKAKPLAGPPRPPVQNGGPLPSGGSALPSVRAATSGATWRMALRWLQVLSDIRNTQYKASFAPCSPAMSKILLSRQIQ